MFNECRHQLDELANFLGKDFSVSNYIFILNENENSFFACNRLFSLCLESRQTPIERFSFAVEFREVFEAWHSIHEFPLMLYLHFVFLPILCFISFLWWWMLEINEKQFHNFFRVCFCFWNENSILFCLLERETKKAALKVKYRASQFLRVTETLSNSLIFSLD